MNLDTIVCADALEFMAGLPSESVDMVLCDLPYGTTDIEWDCLIPLYPLWASFKRITKPRSAIVLTASQPFTSMLITSNLPMFKYEWIWAKTRPSGFLHAKNRPLKNHENVLVFSTGNTLHKGQSESRMEYYPQMAWGKPYIKRSDPKVNLAWGNLGRPSTVAVHTTISAGERYPVTVLDFPNDNHNSLHPTQKPVALFEYLIRTYTQAGDVVLDCCMGSGTTAIAARNTGRHFIGCDSSPEYVELANKRLAKPWQPLLLES